MYMQIHQFIYMQANHIYVQTITHLYMLYKYNIYLKYKYLECVYKYIYVSISLDIWQKQSHLVSAWNSQSSCLRSPRAETADLYHHACWEIFICPKMLVW